MESYYMGIDVSKGYADFVILDAQKQPVDKSFQLDDTWKGQERLREKLKTFFEHRPDATLYAGVESTGGYENNWFHYLRDLEMEMPLHVTSVNPYAVKANSEGAMKRNKTDKISAYNVAEYILNHPEKGIYGTENRYFSLRKKWTFINMLTKQKNQMGNQLESLIYNANPEVLVYCKFGFPKWVYELLLHYPTARCLSRARSKGLERIPYIPKENISNLIENAKKSVASEMDKEMEELIIANVKQILQLDKDTDKQVKKLIKTIQWPEVKLLKTFTGIGDYSAVGLMLEILSIDLFPSAKHLSSFFGLHPVYKMSGDGSYGFHMSKQGRSEPRRILFMVAFNAIQNNPVIKDFYKRLLHRGMNRMAAIGACMHKILRIIYGMLKHNKPFDPEVDRKYQEKGYIVRKNPKGNKMNRYRDYDPQAPISRRQTKKRKEQMTSQSDLVAVNGIESPVPNQIEINGEIFLLTKV